MYEVLGSLLGPDGVTFRVWAPNAEKVSVVGDFNGWDVETHQLAPSVAGVWEAHIPEAAKGHKYKYAITVRGGRQVLSKADPVAFHAESSPGTASVVWDLDYQWADHEFMDTRRDRLALDAPVSIYECHLGSWSRRHGRSYPELAKGLADHLDRTGFTHLELLPIMEHPFDGSWGYQTLGYFAPTSRFGTPQMFMEFVDILHQRGIGVILDWVPSHFAVDGHGLAYFDGTHLYEHADPRQGYHPDWGSYIFNLGRNEVRSFLLSSAHYWFDRYHIDGIRVDAVASMLYLDYSRKEGEWIPNRYGGRENLEAVEFLRRLNSSIYARFPGTQLIAEESTAWPMVSAPVDVGGLGFGYKWDMGWMNDTLRYMALDPLYRSFSDSHRLLTFRALYASTENYVLAMSHDEVVHGKRSLLAKNPGDEWVRAAGLRALLGYQWALPGKKLIFMGAEIGNPFEWNHDGELPFELLEHPFHQGILNWVTDLNRFYRTNPTMHLGDARADGFEWVEADDISRATLSFLRSAEGHPPVLVVVNFTPQEWRDYRIGVPAGGRWVCLLCSNAELYAGSGSCPGEIQAEGPHQGRPNSLTFAVPSMSITFLQPVE